MSRALLFAAALTVAGCLQDRCEMARETAILCGHDFDSTCDGELTARERCEHRCYERWTCWDVEQCQRRCWLPWP